MAALPEFRLEESQKPFECTGVDYFGPFHVRRGRATVKAYGVIFTCAVTRAVHLELADNLSSQSFIYTLRRFICRRGHVKHLISDNGTNFKGANSELQCELAAEVQAAGSNGDLLQAELRKRGVEWTFNPPGASHHGGFWERLIGSVRRIFEALLHDQTQRLLTWEALNTLMCEVESILNDRPLTPISDDVNDFEALTPNHILLGCKGPSPPPGDFSALSDLGARLKKQWKQVQHLATQFWRRWNKEYKVLLHRRTKWFSPNQRNLKEGDAVLLVDSAVPRDHWQLGRVSAVLRNSVDGYVRAAKIRTSRGVVERPITKLCLLETASEGH